MVDSPVPDSIHPARRLAVVINPISGTGRRPGVARARAEQAAALLERRGVEADVCVTERPGHAREFARTAVARGACTVVAWGGDGTVNEVASAVAFQNATLAIIPTGSGNGLARELQIPFDHGRAFDVALGSRERCIDAGELDGHLFFNVAGIGVDARVAHRLADEGAGRRGFLRYLEVTTLELLARKPDDYTIVTDGTSMRVRALLIAIANARQYGNGAIIAPGARVDDGRLDVVVVADRSRLAALMQIPRLFTGQIARVSGVTMRAAVDIEITSGRPVLYHVDGEPHVGGAAIKARSRPLALRVAVP